MTANHHLYPILDVGPPWWQHWQNIKQPGGFEELKRAVTSQSPGDRG